MTPTISAEELCLITGLTDRRHRQLAEEGHFPPPIRSEYQSIPTLQGLWKYLKENESNQLKAEELKSAIASRKMAELKLRRAQRAVIPAKSVVSTWEHIITTAKQRLIGLPAKMVGALAICSTPGEQQAALQAEIDDALSELAQPVTYKFTDTDEEPDDDDAPEHPDPSQDQRSNR